MMPINLSFDQNLDAARREIRDFSNRQVPFAIRTALNRTAKDGEARARTEMERVFDRPKPFTLKSLYVLKASKTSLEASVGIKDSSNKGTPAFKYLASQITGGRRKAKRFERALHFVAGVPDDIQVVPGKGMGLDAHGNIGVRRINALLSRLRASNGRRPEGYVVGQPEGRDDLPPGVWKKERSRLVPKLVFVRHATYRSRFAFADIIHHAVKDEFTGHLHDALREAHATRRD